MLAYGGIAFLWFMGVVRTHLGVHEDRFLSTVTLGSGLLFLATSFGAGVFMISLATLCRRSGAMPRAFVWLTYLPAAALLFGLPHTLWAALLFPLWVLGFILYLLVRHIDAPIAAA